MPSAFEIEYDGGEEKGMQAAKDILEAIGTKEIRLGYTAVFLIEFAGVEKNKAGFSLPPGENGQLGNQRGSWPKHWLLIGREDGYQDPIFIDTSRKEFPVFTAMCGEGEWIAERIAASLEAFAASLRQILLLAKGRECPISLMKNPLSTEARQRGLEEIRRLNPGVPIDFWERWLGG
jgi:hypothetical protein